MRVLVLALVLALAGCASPPVFIVKVRCPFVAGNPVEVVPGFGEEPVILDGHSIRLEPAGDPCPGHELEIRR